MATWQRQAPQPHEIDDLLEIALRLVYALRQHTQVPFDQQQQIQRDCPED